MAIKFVVRGDSYAELRPLFIIKLVDANTSPYPLANCTIRTTYKPAATDPNTDTTDDDAPIKHEIVIDADGNATTENGLFLIGAASNGIIHEHLTSAESKALPLGVELFSDVEITKGDDVVTFIQTDTIQAVDGFTNREV